MHSKKGFTIIEVVLVLAIAGLIFLMVFVALPTLQRSQRDTQRKNFLSTVSSSIVSYISNNNKLPSSSAETVAVTTESVTNKAAAGSNWKGFAYSYLLNSGNDAQAAPSELYYTLVVAIVNNTTAKTYSDSNSDIDTIYVDLGASCQTDGKVQKEKNDGSRSFALTTRLENGGFYCIDN